MTRIVRVKVQKSKRQHKERDEQVKFVSWLKKNKIWVSGSGVGVNLPIVVATILKRMGVAKGYPDIFVPLPKNGFHGFYLEMKSEDGDLKKEQVEWLMYLKDQKYYAEVAYSFEEAKTHFLFYLNDSFDAAKSLNE